MQTANIIITSRCNQHCPFCFYADAEGREQSCADVTALLSTLKHRNVQAIVITGGEPSVYSQLPQLLGNILEGPFEKIAIHTNGSLCERADVLELVRAHPARFGFVISLHGPTPDTHDGSVSCRGSFARALRLAQWSHVHAISFSVNSAILRDNTAHLAAMVTLSQGIGASRVTFLLVHDCSSDLRFKASIADAVSAVRLLGDLGNEYVRTDGIPYCLLRNREEIVGESNWPRPLLVVSLRGQVYDYTRDIINDLRFKHPDCQTCLMTSVCMGVYREYERDFCAIYPGPIRKPQ